MPTRSSRTCGIDGSTAAPPPRGDTALAIAHRAIAFEMGRYPEALEAGNKFGRIDEARAAVNEARRVELRVSLEMLQRGIGASRPAIAARRNAALRKAGLE